MRTRLQGAVRVGRRGAAGRLVVFLLALSGADPVLGSVERSMSEACERASQPLREVLRRAKGVYEVTATSGRDFRVRRTWRGEPFRWLELSALQLSPLGVPCADDEPIRPGAAYWVLVDCTAPTEVSHQVAVFSCSAEAWSPEQAAALREALLRGLRIGRQALVSQLHLRWADLDPSALHDWLVEIDRYAEVDDWSPLAGYDDAWFSLTGRVIRSLRELLAGTLACEQSEEAARKRFAQLGRELLPPLTELLESPRAGLAEAYAFDELVAGYRADCPR